MKVSHSRIHNRNLTVAKHSPVVRKKYKVAAFHETTKPGVLRTWKTRRFNSRFFVWLLVGFGVLSIITASLVLPLTLANPKTKTITQTTLTEIADREDVKKLTQLVDKLPRVSFDVNGADYELLKEDFDRIAQLQDPQVQATQTLAALQIYFPSLNVISSSYKVQLSTPTVLPNLVNDGSQKDEVLKLLISTGNARTNWNLRLNIKPAVYPMPTVTMSALQTQLEKIPASFAVSVEQYESFAAAAKAANAKAKPLNDYWPSLQILFDSSVLAGLDKNYIFELVYVGSLPDGVSVADQNTVTVRLKVRTKDNTWGTRDYAELTKIITLTPSVLNQIQSAQLQLNKERLNLFSEPFNITQKRVLSLSQFNEIQLLINSRNQQGILDFLARIQNTPTARKPDFVKVGANLKFVGTKSTLAQILSVNQDYEMELNFSVGEEGITQAHKTFTLSFNANDRSEKARNEAAASFLSGQITNSRSISDVEYTKLLEINDQISSPQDPTEKRQGYLNILAEVFGDPSLGQLDKWRNAEMRLFQIEGTELKLNRILENKSAILYVTYGGELVGKQLNFEVRNDISPNGQLAQNMRRMAQAVAYKMGLESQSIEWGDPTLRYGNSYAQFNIDRRIKNGNMRYALRDEMINAGIAFNGDSIQNGIKYLFIAWGRIPTFTAADLLQAGLTEIRMSWKYVEIDRHDKRVGTIFSFSFIVGSPSSRVGQRDFFQGIYEQSFLIEW